MKDIRELKKIASDLVDKRQAPLPKRDQALASSIVGLAMLDRYGKTPQLEDMDPHGFGLAPVDVSGRQIFLAVREQSPFYFREQQLGKYDIVVFALYHNDMVDFQGWLPENLIPTMPLKLFANSSPYMVTADLMLPMPESFDFVDGCDTLVCAEPAIWNHSVEGWDCVMCDKTRFSSEARVRHGSSDGK